MRKIPRFFIATILRRYAKSSNQPNFLPGETATLMNLGASAVTMARRRLYQKAFGRSPMTPEDVDEWIMEVG